MNLTAGSFQLGPGTAILTSTAPGGAGQRIGRQADPVPRQYDSTSPVRHQTTIDFLGAQVANPFYPSLPGPALSGLNVSRSQLLRPYPQFSSIAFNNNPGYSWYHAMQTRFEKRFAAGYTFNVAWTWSRFMEATGYLNDTDRVPKRVISGQDRTHRVVVAALGELPFGRGRRFGSGARGIERIRITERVPFQFRTEFLNAWIPSIRAPFSAPPR